MSSEDQGTRIADAPLDAEAPASLRALLGERARLHRFVLLERIGAGNMGELHTAYDARLDRKIALKLVRLGRRNPKADARLLREAQALAKLSHPNVVNVYEVGSDGDRVFVAMEYVQGQNLAAWLAAAKPLPEPRRVRELLAHFRDAGRGLAAVHAAGFAHRDFKPENVLVGVDGRVRLVDFGLARNVLDAADSQVEMRVDHAPAPPDLDTLTATDTLMGTPRFMAPEQWELRRGDGRSDQFAFSVALYHALYGAWPFEGIELPTLRRAVLEGEVRQPPRKREVPTRLRRALLRNLAPDPDARAPDMSELLAAIDDALTPPRRRRWAIAGGVVVLASLVAIGRALLSTPEPRLELGPAIDVLELELAAERRHQQVSAQIVELDAAGKLAEADALFASFAALPQHAHTHALGLAWREHATRLQARGDAAGELAALGEAHWASPSDAGRRAVLIELARAFDRGHRYAQLGAVLDVLGDELSGPSDTLLAMRAREAASREDFVGTLELLGRPSGSALLDELGPLLRELDRATLTSLRVASHDPRLSALTRVAGLDLDGDRVDDLIHAPAEGPLEILAAKPELPRLRVLSLDGGHGEASSFRPITLPKAPRAGHAWVVGQFALGRHLFDLAPLALGQAPRALLDATHSSWVLGDLFEGPGWAGDEAIGLHALRRRLEGLREGEIAFTPEPSLAELDSQPVAASVIDLDDDGRDELIVGVGGWWAYDLRVLSPSATQPGHFELESRLKLGSMTSLTSYHDGEGHRLAVNVAPDTPSPRVFPRHAPIGVAPGIYLLDWAGPGQPLVTLDAITLPDSLEVFAGDLDGDGRDELIVQRNPQGIVIIKPGLPEGVVWLDALRFEALHDLDANGDAELIVSEVADGRVVVLGSGDARLPPRERSLPARSEPPTTLAPPLAELWQRAETLARIGLHDQARSSFVELARLVEPDEARQAHRRAAELAERSGQRVEAAGHFEAAGDADSLGRAIDLYAAIHRFDRAADLAATLATSDETQRPRADALRRLAAPAEALRFAFDQPLDDRWRIARPGVVRQTAEGLHVESIGGPDTLLLRRPFAWTGERLALEVDLEVSRLEWGAMLFFELVALEDQTSTTLGKLRVASIGGGGHYRLDLSDENWLDAGSFGDDRQMVGAFLPGGPHRLQLRFDAALDQPMVRISARATTRESSTPIAELAYDDHRAPGSLRPGRYELRIRTGEAPWQRAVARIISLTLLGAQEDPAIEPASPREQILLALTNAEHERALELLDEHALEPRDAAWLRVLALEQLGRFTEAPAPLALALGRCDDDEGLARFGYALRVEPDRFGPLLRELCPTDRFVLATWTVAWDALFHHPDLVDLHRTMTTQLSELERFEPRDAAQARASADLLTARSRGWYMQSLESAAESDLRRALEIGEQALAGDIPDPELRAAIERLIALGHVRLAGILQARNRLDDVPAELRRALDCARAPEIIADVIVARGMFDALHEQPIWAEIAAAQRGLH